MGLDAESDVALSMVSDNTQRLTSAVNSLPQLMEKKRRIDMHTTIATGKNISTYAMNWTSAMCLKMEAAQLILMVLTELKYQQNNRAQSTEIALGDLTAT